MFSLEDQTCGKIPGMYYTELSSRLSSLFSPDLNEITIPGSQTRIINTDFNSDTFKGKYFSGNDYSIKENIKFSYPVFVPACDSRKVILLLHGLNERSWNKYLVWAHYLSEATCSYVILFPISFHINRSPVSWKDPRSMLTFLKERIRIKGDIRNSCFANVALSNRLADDPRRFLKSGYQSVGDVVKLMSQIREGNHSVIPSDVRINIFAYSIGAFMAQIIMMADPEQIFSESKLFMFCGGAVFSSMYGESKLIMDRLAYESLFSYYLDYFEEEIRRKRSLPREIVAGKLGLIFRSMIDFNRLRDIREKTLSGLADRLCAVGLKKDTVIPAAGIVRTLEKHNKVEILDFPYNYRHENPFPVLQDKVSVLADRSFDKIFERAALFLE